LIRFLPLASAFPGGVFLLLVAACQSPAGQPVGPAEQPAQQSPRDRQDPGEGTPPDARVADPLQYGIYAFLAAEFAAQRGHPGQAARWYGRVAAVTADPSLYGRGIEAALEADNPKLALSQARRWREAAPEAPDPLLALARVHLLQGQRGKSAAAMGELFRSHGHRDDLLLEVGQRLAHVGGLEGATTVLRRAAEDEDSGAAAHLAYGHLLARTGRQEAATRHLQQARDLRPDWELAVVELAQAQEVESGLEILEGFLAEHPDALKARRRYAQGLLAAERPEEAEAIYTELVQTRTEDVEARIGLGLARLQLGRLREAEGPLKEALELDPGNDTALFHLGRAAEEQGDYARAKGFYSRVAGDGLTEEARIREAVTALRSDDLERALQIVRRMRTYNPGNPEYHRLEARILADMDQLQAAERVASQALEEHSEHVELLYTRAMARERMGDYAGMEEDIRRVIELRPEEARAYNFLGFSLADREVRLGEALDLLEKANRLEPNQGYIVDSLGWVHYRLGNLDRAEELLRRALRLSSGDPEILSHLGEVLEARGEAEEARAVWQRALEQTDGDSELTRELRHRLGRESGSDGA